MDYAPAPVDVRFWRFADDPTAPAFVLYWTNSGHWSALALNRPVREWPEADMKGVSEKLVCVDVGGFELAVLQLSLSSDLLREGFIEACRERS